MSFGGENVSNITLKKFESQGEVDEKKRRRQEEWDKVRKADDPLECPEEEKRSLFEQLQAVKDAKEQDFEEEHKLRNSVKGLEEDEVGFLNFVSKRQMEIEKARRSEEDSILQEMRDSALAVSPGPSSKHKDELHEKSRPSCSGTSRKSQQTLLCGAVKRKRSRSRSKSPEKGKRRKSIEADRDPSPAREATKRAASTSVQQSKGVARVIGILPGIGEYSEDSSDSTSSSESDLDDLFTQKTVIRKVQIVESHH